MGSTKLPRRDAMRIAALGAGATLFQPLANIARAAPDASGTITLGIPGVPSTLDPLNQNTHDWMVASQLIFENLVEFDVDGVLQPQLAKALPTISADKLVYDFALREDVTFSNGQPLTAEDVKYSFDWMLDPANRAMRRSTFTRITKVTAVDPYHVRIELSEPYGPWLAFLTKSMGIFPKGSRESNPPDYFRNGPKGMGTGPAIFEEWRQNDYISLIRNPTYWQKGVPAWERVVIRQMPEDSTRVAYIRSGQLDLMSAPPPRDFDQLKTVPGLVCGSRPTLGGWVAINTDNNKPPFDDVNFRRAVSCAIDRDVIATRVFRDLMDPSAVAAPKSAWWYDAASDKASGFDLDRAKSYLAKSRYATGAVVEISVPATAYILDVRDAALVVQSQLKRLGIEVKIKTMEYGPLLQSMIRGDEPASMLVNMSPGEPTYLLQNVLMPSQILSKTVNYANPKLGVLLTQAFAETEQEKLKPIYAAIQALLAEDQPMIWLGFVHTANVWRSRIHNFKPNQGLTLVPKPITLGA